MLYGDEIEEVQFHSNQADVTLKSGVLASSKLIIGSDGNKSRIK